MLKVPADLMCSGGKIRNCVSHSGLKPHGTPPQTTQTEEKLVLRIHRLASSPVLALWLAASPLAALTLRSHIHTQGLRTGTAAN